MWMLECTDAEGVFAIGSRRAQSKSIVGKRPPLEGTRPSPCILAMTASLMGGFTMSGGIYQILNSVNGNRYVGSAVNLRKRWQNHLSGLRRGQHPNRHLQRAYDKYGESAFVFSLLEHIEDSLQLIPREQYYLDTFLPEYNISPTAGSQLGFRPSAETRTNLSIAQMGKRHSMETRQKMSKAQKGRLFSEEHRRKLSEAQKGERNHNYGKHPSADTLRKLSGVTKGERNPFYGKHHSKETRRKLSEANRGKRHPNYGKHHSAETRAKMSEARKAYWRRMRAAKEKQT